MHILAALAVGIFISGFTGSAAASPEEKSAGQ